MRDDLELNAHRALVTGGTEGIGQAVVARLCQAGAKVLPTARKTPADLSDANLFVAADVACRGLRHRGMPPSEFIKQEIIFRIDRGR